MLIIFIACQFVVLAVVVVVAGIAEKRAERAHDDNANGVRLCCTVLCCAVFCCVALCCVGSLSGHWPRRQSFAHINRR